MIVEDILLNSAQRARLFRRGILLMALALILSGCDGGVGAMRTRLDETAARLNHALAQAKADVVRLRQEAERLLADPVKLAAAGVPDPETHRFFGSEGVYYKYRDDGGCGLWASGYTPVEPEVLGKIALLETLEPKIAGLVSKGGLIAQAYLLSSDNFALFFPYLDSAAIFPPRADFGQTFAPFYEAGPGRNPKRREVWLKPYLDATGKGYMVTISSPIYIEDVFQGVAGGDIVARAIMETFLDPERTQMLLNKELIPLAVTEKCAALLELQDFSKFRYLNGVAKDVYAPEKYGLMQAGPAARRLGESLAREKTFTWETGDRTFEVYAAPVKETDWLLLEMTEQ